MDSDEYSCPLETSSLSGTSQDSLTPVGPDPSGSVSKKKNKRKRRKERKERDDQKKVPEKKQVKRKPKKKTRKDTLSGPSDKDYQLPGPCKEPSQDLRKTAPPTGGSVNQEEKSGMDIGPNDMDDLKGSTIRNFTR